MGESLQKVSIVLPTYNGAKYIRQSIDSCLNQTYKNIELIIVDDGSKDETPEIVMSYKDDRIKHIWHEKNRGLPHALNTGFAKATGEYLTWTSDDNYYSNDAIEKMLHFLKNNNCSFVYCDFYKFYDNTSFDLYIYKLPKNPILENCNNIGPCFLYTRKVGEEIGDYDPDAFLAEDYDYWIRVSTKFSMCHLEGALYHYRIHEKSLFSTRFHEIQVVALLVRIKNNILDVEQGANILINTIAQSGKFYKLNKVLFRIFFNREINIILRDFKTKKINFNTAKLKTIKIINLYSILNPVKLAKQLKNKIRVTIFNTPL